MSRDSRFIAVGFALLLVSAALTSGVVVADTSDAYDGKLSGAANIETLLGYSSPDYLMTSGVDADPHWYVEVSDAEDLSSLRAWVNESDSREVLAEPANDTLLIRASPASVLGGLETLGEMPYITNHGSGLVGLSYVEHIDVEQRHDIAPVETLASEDEFEPPISGALVRGSWDASSLAFNDDVNTTTLGDARDVLGVNDVGTNGSGITIAVVDTGLTVDNTSSPSLYGNRIVAAKNTITNETGLAAVEDGNSHGSWATAAVGADAAGTEYDGMCTGCDLIVTKSMADDGSGSTRDIVEGIEFAEANGADIISLSLGSTAYSPTLAEAIRDALAGNTTAVFVAAGNSAGRPVGHFINSPADVPEEGVLTIGAATTENASSAQPAYFSSRGPDAGRDLSNGVTVGQEIDLAAPGMKVEAPIYTTGGYRTNSTKSGTSMATPIAAGIGGLVLASDASLVNDTEAFATRMRETAVPMPNGGVTEVGNGMVNATNAVEKTEPEDSQESVREDAAIARDKANRGYSGADLLTRLLGAV